MGVETMAVASHAKETDVETMEVGTMVIMVTMEDSTMVTMEDSTMVTMEDSIMVIMEVGTMAIMEGSTMEIMGDLLGMKAILHQLDKSVQIVAAKKPLFIYEI